MGFAPSKHQRVKFGLELAIISRIKFCNAMPEPWHSRQWGQPAGKEEMQSRKH